MAIGIYKITNLVNNKFYLGSSIDIKRRFKEHKVALKGNKHYNIYLQSSYNKYGKDYFTFEIIEECEDLINREQYYIDTLKPEYNLQPLAYRTKGTKRSLETKLKQSQIRLGIKFTEETKKLMSLAKLGTSFRSKKVYQLDLSNKIMNQFNSITEASKITNISRTSINNCLKEITKTAGRFKWRYVNGR